MKKTLLFIVVLLVIIQFIRPNKNESNNLKNSITTVVNTPSEVEKILKTSCYDCHSNKTNYPWYNNIAPVSWYLAQHVNEGKEHVNFSEWTTYNKNQQKHIIEDLKEELQGQKMPLKSYLLTHADAKMSQEQYKELLNWVNTITIK